MTLLKTLALTASIVVLAASIIGCGSKDSTTVVGADGSKTTVTTDSSGGGTVKMEGNGTSASIGGGTTVTEADLGVPFYPGSAEKQGAAMKVDTPTEKSYMCVRTTSDEPAKVKEFYESKVAGLKFTVIEANGDSTAMGETKLENGAKVAISATRKKDATETEVTVAMGLEIKK